MLEYVRNKLQAHERVYVGSNTVTIQTDERIKRLSHDFKSGLQLQLKYR